MDYLRESLFIIDQTFTYLLARTFLRSGDYLGLLVRLSIIGGVAIYYLTFGIGQIVTCGSFPLFNRVSIAAIMETPSESLDA